MLSTLPMLMAEGPISNLVEPITAMWPYLLASCALALLLNIAVTTAIKALNGLGFVLCSCMKDVVVVAVQPILMGIPIPKQQVMGFTIAVCGVMLHSTRKVQKEQEEREKSIAAGSRETQTLLPR